MKLLFLLYCLVVSPSPFAQTTDERIKIVMAQFSLLEEQQKQLTGKLESLKLEKIREDLQVVGLPAIQPGDELVHHLAYSLSFVPRYKQARWVAHIISPDVLSGVVFRTNDFRTDPQVKSGSAVEADYFTKSINTDSTIVYDGFGYDRGHLAPSADFRWSQSALSESYYYSNMSPQLAEFNRGAWGNLEDAIRSYLYRNPSSQLYVVTGPLLEEGLPVIERGKNKMPIPRKFWKVVLDLRSKRAIGFIMPNESISKPLENFAVPVNEVEKLTGLDFFPGLGIELQEQVESQYNSKDWLAQTNTADVEPLDQDQLPRNHFNSILAKEAAHRNEEITVCGTVVGTRISRAGNILLNLDKQFPGQVFTVFIKKDDIPNFDYKPGEFLKGKIVCFKGRVINLGGTAAMYLKSDNSLKMYQAGR